VIKLLKINPMKNIAGRILAIGLLLWLLTQAPILIDIFVNLFQVIGLFVVRAIEIEPVGFAIGFLVIFGLAREGKR
jgi:hypothetical protein